MTSQRTDGERPDADRSDRIRTGRPILRRPGPVADRSFLESGPVSRFAHHGIDPIGSAGHYDAFLLVELPLPWGRDLFDDLALCELEEAVTEAVRNGVRWRILGLVPPGEDPTPSSQVICYRRGECGFTVFERSEGYVPSAALAHVCAEIVAGAELTEPTPVGDGHPCRDVLICTHGRRDRRCGSMGARLYEAADGRYGDSRVWRISHTGGHRFAPTAITFPEGMFWAHLDLPTLDGIVSRGIEPRAIGSHYRGGGAYEQMAQPAEREAFVLHGWDWLAHVKAAEVIGTDEHDRCEVRLLHRAPDGSEGAYEATVGVGRLVPTVNCDTDCHDPDARSEELQIFRFARVDV